MSQCICELRIQHLGLHGTVESACPESVLSLHRDTTLNLSGVHGFSGERLIPSSLDAGTAVLSGLCMEYNAQLSESHQPGRVESTCNLST